LWACAYLHITYWDVRNKVGPVGSRIDIDPLEHPELVKAMRLLEWAMNHALHAEGTEEWPEDLPRPSAPNEDAHQDQVPDQIFLRALGFILCHEIAHAMLKHSYTKESSPSIEQEKDADREAIASYFDGCEGEESGEFQARGIGVITALYFCMLSGFFRGAWGGSTHPPKWLRLDIVLGALNLEENHPCLVFAAELKSLYLSISGHPSGGDFPTPAESIQGLIEECSSGELGTLDEE
jgi:hypothetical protein